MIIVEGPDGAGKTTLVRDLQERYGLSEGQRGTSKRSELYTVTMPDTYRALTKAIKGIGPPLIWDRLFYSEFVYHKFTDRDCRFNEAHRQWINNLITLCGFPVIVCLPPVDTVIANAAKDEQMAGVNENLAEIYIAYVTMMRWMPPQMVIYDYTAEPPDRIYQIVEGYMIRRRAREW